ncbi:MAG: hypothetical protein RBT34_04400 [Anaerolineaceae bacterium]|jgi:hypothetical protein|nr:hypothetical protein [Anaerolineaceae bacterium]
MKNTRYTVIVNKYGVTLKQIKGLSLSKAVRKTHQLIQEVGQDEFVYIQWHRSSDGKRGFYNSNGNHQLIARAWN